MKDNTLAFDRWYNLRRKAREILAYNSTSRSDKEHAASIIDATDGIAESNPEFKAYVLKRTEQDNLQALLDEVQDAVSDFRNDDYGDSELAYDFKSGKITYLEIIEKIHAAGQKLTELANRAKY